MSTEETHIQNTRRKKALEYLVGGCGCLFGLAWLALLASIVYVVAHFIVKFW